MVVFSKLSWYGHAFIIYPRKASKMQKHHKLPFSGLHKFARNSIWNVCACVCQGERQRERRKRERRERDCVHVRTRMCASISIILCVRPWPWQKKHGRESCDTKRVRERDTPGRVDSNIDVQLKFHWPETWAVLWLFDPATCCSQSIAPPTPEHYLWTR